MQTGHESLVKTIKHVMLYSENVMHPFKIKQQVSIINFKPTSKPNSDSNFKRDFKLYVTLPNRTSTFSG